MKFRYAKVSDIAGKRRLGHLDTSFLEDGGKFLLAAHFPFPDHFPDDPMSFRLDFHC